MPTIEDYVNQLIQLKKTDPAKYSSTLEQYKLQYPQFYEKLMPLLEVKEVIIKGGSKLERFKSFYKEYWPYLTAIIGGGVTIVILLLMIILRI